MTTQLFDDIDSLLSRGQSDLDNYLSDGSPEKDGYSDEEIDNLNSLSTRSPMVAGLAMKLVNNSLPVLASEILAEVNKAILATGKVPDQVVAFDTVLERDDYEALLPQDIVDRIAHQEQSQSA